VDRRSPVEPHTSTPSELRARLAADRRSVPYLLYRDGEGGQRILPLDDARERVAIGRRPSSDIALSWDPEVSRLHAALERIGLDWVLCDEGLSHNGTSINGSRMRGRHRLRVGDVIGVGDTLIVFCGPSDGSATQTAAEGRAEVALTRAQRRVLVALCRPLASGRYAVPASNGEIAEELTVTVETVKGTLTRLFEAFGVQDLPQNQKRAALARRALETGMVNRPDA
jgi:pSer/pThr/pTyr-binding forkhead associated (FHA) protein